MATKTSATKTKPAEMPEDVDAHVGWFDTFATGASKVVSRAWFFAFCVLLEERSDRATQDKLNAIAGALSKMAAAQGLKKDAAELRSAVGLEDRESSDGK